MIKVEIDEGSGFCFGVVTAIHKAEEELAKGETLYCLGDIVHNSREVERLKAMGLITINRDEFRQLRNAKVLLRAHGEPPETYQIAHKNNIEIIDATCPVVLRLQKRIKQEFRKEDFEEKQIVIYGKNGHAEVLGLVGQTGGVLSPYHQAASYHWERYGAVEGTGFQFPSEPCGTEGGRSYCRYIQQDDGTVEERTTAFKGTESFSGSADQCFTDGSDYVESR